MKTRLKVFQVIECGGPGGTGNQVAALCNGLDPNIFELHLVYAVRPGNDPKDYERLASGAAAFHPIPEMVREIRPWSDFVAWLKLFALFRRERPDIVHAHSSKAGVLARTAAFAARVPRIYYSPRGFSFQQSDRSCLSRAMYRRVEAAASRIGTVVAVSESEGILARKLACKVRVRVVRDAYLGKPCPESNGQPGQIRVFASGRMSFPRNPEAFVRLAGRLAATSNDTRCVWIGGGEFEAAVNRLRAALRLEKTLEITGWLEHEEALSRLKSAAVFVQYSRWEGLPNSVLEAMALGIPIVASDIPPHRELIDHGVNGLLAADEAALTRCVLSLTSDHALRARLGKAGRRLVDRNFTREGMLKNYSRLYSAPV